MRNVPSGKKEKVGSIFQQLLQPVDCNRVAYFIFSYINNLQDRASSIAKILTINSKLCNLSSNSRDVIK